ncbi:cupin domain-containing protein [Rubrivirga sp. IMCC43871]|uniref:cupin domain-containing protein n=1 Tax=Rubrivirga sp. IMCC43871 TaxID=3391575 RepID=UPI00398FC6FE
MTPVSLANAFRSFDATWTPHVAAELNGQHVKLAKLEGAFVWHDHADEDELFWVVSGRLRIELRGRAPVELGPGEFVVVPRGVAHRPVALPTAEVVLFEPASTAHTGDVETDRTVHDLPRL